MEDHSHTIDQPPPRHRIRRDPALGCRPEQRLGNDAQAAMLPGCNGITEAEAVALGYEVWPGTGADEQLGDSDGDADWVMGMGGLDEITTGSGMDVLCGGAGDDIIDPGDGLDHVFGDYGNDIIDLGPGIFDNASGGRGQDEIDGGAGPDTILGDLDPASPRPVPTGARDDLRGGEGDDTIYGGDRGDFLNGDDGDDHLFGENGDDELSGGLGTDDADGGAGSNLCEAETRVNC